MSRRTKPVSLRAALVALSAVTALGLAAVLATAGLTTGSGGSRDTTPLNPGTSTQDWIGSSPAGNGPETLNGLPQAVIPPFADPVTFPVGGNPTGIATGDFNNDSNQDVATSNSVSFDVAVLFGAGDGTLGTAAFYGVGFEPAGVTTGYFNGDAHLDLATANSASDDVSVLINNGDGTYKPEVFYGVGSFPFAILSGDYDEDGIADLATANAFTDDVSILLGKGDGTFFDEIFFPAGFIPIALAQGDYDGDGNVDLAVVNFGDENVSILPGHGDGTFGTDTGPYPIGVEPASIVTADFNGDTILDLATANLGSDDVSILLGNGDGTFQNAVPNGVGMGPLSVTVADFDRDGTMDLATADVSSVTILLGNGDGTFMMAQMFDVDIEPFVVFASDLNADDFPDIVVGNSTDDSISILINQFNRPPVADAGDDRNVECGSAQGTAVTLDGSRSSDPDGDTLTYTWTGPFPEGGGTVDGVAPVVTLPMGSSEIALIVSDGTLVSEPDTIAITVADTVAPTLTGSFALSGDLDGWNGGKGGGHDDDDDGGMGGNNDDDDDGGHGHDKDEDVLLVEFAAIDACDPSPTVAGTFLVGTCQSLAAVSGDLIEFDRKKHCKAAKCKHGDVLELAGPSLTLRVTGSDSQGNEATPLDVPYVPVGCNDLAGDASAGSPESRQRPTSTKVPTSLSGNR